MISKQFGIGLFLGMLLMGCASVSFPYAWYYPNFKSYEGTILAHDPSNDLDGTVCGIDPKTGEHGCVVMIKAPFKAMVLDYESCKTKVEYLERNCTCDR